MADRVCRSLRDGGFEGELVPSLIVKDSTNPPFGDAIFFHFLSRLLSDIGSDSSRSRGIVLVALSRSPLYYLDLLKERELDQDLIDSRFRILDCYTDPHGWIQKLSRNRPRVTVSSSSELFTDISDLDKLFSSTVSLGQGFNLQGTTGFSVAIDSVSELSRHTNIQSVARYLNNIRTSDQVFSTFCRIHTDFHNVREMAALEYISSIVVAISENVKGVVDDSNVVGLSKSYSRKAKLLVRIKLRNGRVRVMGESLVLERRLLKFSPIPKEDDTLTPKNVLPKVQFNLSLSENEVIERSKVVLPYEHRGGNGRPIEIYDGRLHPKEDSNQIIYFRDSDDEIPYSDEDPDDDLDI